MALVNSIEPAALTAALTSRLSEHLGDVSEVEITDIAVSQASGMSSESILLTASWRDASADHSQQLVVRVAPRGDGVFQSYDLGREAEVMSAVAHGTKVPAPTVWFTEHDRDLLGAEFVVMERCMGKVPPDDPPFTASGWVLDLEREQRSRLVDNTLALMIELHRPSLDELGLAHLLQPEMGQTPIEQSITEWRSYYEWAVAGVEHPTVSAGLDWIAERIPPTRNRTVLNWGDARFGNLMFGDDLDVTGAFDWEMASPGVPDVDVAWCAFLHMHHTEGLGLDVPTGMLAPRDLARRYEELGGGNLPDFDFYLVWSAVRCGMIFARVGHYLTEAGLVPAERQMWSNNASTRLLAQLIDAPPPEGPMNGWIDGNR